MPPVVQNLQQWPIATCQVEDSPRHRFIRHTIRQCVIGGRVCRLRRSGRSITIGSTRCSRPAPMKISQIYFCMRGHSCAIRLFASWGTCDAGGCPPSGLSTNHTAMSNVSKWPNAVGRRVATCDGLGLTHNGHSTFSKAAAGGDLNALTSLRTLRHERSALRNSPFDSNGDVATRRILSVHFRAGSASAGSWLGPAWSQCTMKCVSTAAPNALLIATSAASRPYAVKTRPLRGALFRGSKVGQLPPT